VFFYPLDLSSTVVQRDPIQTTALQSVTNDRPITYRPSSDAPSSNCFMLESRIYYAPSMKLPLAHKSS
jgi:hypothetical protein